MFKQQQQRTGCFVVNTATENVTSMPQATWQADSPLGQEIWKWMRNKDFTSTQTGMWFKHMLLYSDKKLSVRLLGCSEMFHKARRHGSSCKTESRDCELTIFIYARHSEPSTIDVSTSHCQSSPTSTPPSVASSTLLQHQINWKTVGDNADKIRELVSTLMLLTHEQINCQTKL